MKIIDYYLNKITMYQLLVYGLFALAGLSILFSLTGTLSFEPKNLIAGFLIIMMSGFVTKIALTKLYGIAPNKESMLITTLIVYFVFSPPSNIQHAVILSLVTVLAVASRFILIRNKKHIFNPVAISATIIGLAGIMQASWWIGNTALGLFVFLFGVLILRKLHRFQLFLCFAIVAIVILILRDYQTASSASELLQNILVSSPLLFLGMIMLTEPSTLPPTRNLQLLYGVFVGLIYASGLHVGDIYATPEIALVAGNIFAYALSPSLRSRSILTLKKRSEIAPGIYELCFTSDREIAYQAGQYLDITLPTLKSDARGNRRTFTIASAPHEKDIIITFNTSKRMSSFKADILALPIGAKVYADHVAGDFTASPGGDAVWLAGGIGITPFRSMAQDLIATKASANIALIYKTSQPNKRVYSHVFAQAGVIEFSEVNEIPNFQDRQFYISGPDGYVSAQKAVLKKLSIPQKNIKTDYFSGY